MNPSQIESYNNISIDQILQSQLNGPTQNNWVIVFAKARLQQCTQDSIKMTLMLLERDGDKWLEVLKRFSILQFKLVFSFCIKRMKTYNALMESVWKFGQSEHQRMFQEKIQKAIDGEFIDPCINSHELWSLYLSYLSQWVTHLPNRTLLALEKIEKRLSVHNNIYQLLVDRQKIPFLQVLCEIIKYHQDKYMRRLQLRKFWESIPNIVIFLQQTLYTKNMIYRVANSFDSFDNKPQGEIGQINMRDNSQHWQSMERDKETMVMFLIKCCQVTILQDVFMRSTRLATVFLKVQLIDYRKFDRIEQLQSLESSLIYHVRSDDLPSLISQLLVSLSKNIPNFLSLFVSQCLFYLKKQNLDEVVASDIILKLCILSKQIIQHTEYNGWDFSIKELIDRLIVLSDSRSQVTQIKTLLMMHYFKEILPESYFMQYHNIIFRILKHFIKQQIQQNHMHSNEMFERSNQSSNFPFNFQPFKYTMVSYLQCIRILQEQTEKKQEFESMEMKIRKKKFKSQKYINDLFRNNVLELSDKLIDLVNIQGQCEEQTKLLQILRNLLTKYPIVQERNTVFLIKTLSRQFMQEYQRLRGLSNARQKNFSKISVLLQCLQLVWNEVSQQSYLECQQHMVYIMGLLKQQYVIDFEEEIVRLLGMMIVKANMITPQLNNFIICSKQVLINSEVNLLSIQPIIKELTRVNVVKSIRQEWRGLIMFITNIFNQYLSHKITNQSMQLYHKNWRESSHLIQLFVQSYSQQYQHQVQLRSTLYNMQSLLLSSHKNNEHINQLLMTIHHIVISTKSQRNTFSQQFMNNSQNYSIQLLKRITQLSIYKEKYSLHLIILTILDTLNVNLRKHIFDFSSPQNPIYPFLESYKSLSININDLIPTKENSPNDILPLSKININQYATILLDSLRKDKVIDIQQFTQLKSIFLPHNYLISHSLFQ